MSTLATLMVGLGYDLSALEKGAPEAFRLINSQTAGISAEMKRTSREGAESLRLIDEALDIHMSRPLTRIITQEFPAFASAMQSVLGAGVVGALAVIGVEAFDKASKSIEKAQKAQEDFAASTRKAKSTFDEIMASFEKSETIRSLSGLDKKIFEIDSSMAEETRHKLDELTKALEENAKAAAAAGGWWTKFKAAVGDAASGISSSANSINAEKIDAQLSGFKDKLDALGRIDGLNQTHYAASAISSELDVARRKLQQLQADEGKTVTMPAVGPGAVPQTRVLVSPEEVAAQQRYIEGLEKLQQIKSAGDVGQTGAENDARQAAAIEQAREEVKELQGDLKRWNEAADEGWKSWMRTNEQLEKALGKMRDMGTLAEISQHAKQVKALNFPDIGTVAPPPGAPQLKDQAELAKVTNDQNESWKKAGEILESIETPQQKYQTGLAIIRELQEQGRLSTEQFVLAEQKLQEQLVQSGNHIEQMQKQLEKLLSHSDSARDGVRAFFLQLQIDSAENGKFAFDLLKQGLKGFEDSLTQAVFTGKAKWEDMFRSLGETAFKFLLNKEISGFFQMISGTGVGKSLGLGNLIPGGAGGAAGTAQLTAASTTLQTGSTMLITAATTLQAAAATLSASGTAGAGGGFGSLAGIVDTGGFASGTDSAPGGFAWVGEQGPELLNLPSGTSVTPAASLRGSGGDQHFYIDAKGAEIGVEEKIVRAIAAARPQMIGEAIANFSEIQRRSVPQR
jgi:hypothetical protein